MAFTHKEEAVLFMFARIFRIGIGLDHSVLRKVFPKRIAALWQHGLRVFALALVIAVPSIPTNVWAKAPGEGSPNVLQIRSDGLSSVSGD